MVKGNLAVGQADDRGLPFIPVLVGQCEFEVEMRRLDRRMVLAEPIKARGLIDTSRRITTVAASILEAADLLPRVALEGRRRLAEDKAYCISLTIGNEARGGSVTLPTVHAMAHADDACEAAVMIGTDVLRKFDFRLAGAGKTFTLSR